MRYLILVPAGARRTSPHTFAVESAFAQHLRELGQELGTRCAEIVVAMPYLDDAAWTRVSHELTEIDEVAERIRFVPLDRFGASQLEFMRDWPRVMTEVARVVREADFVHSHFSHDILRPVGAFSCLVARALRKPVIAVNDIDRRRDTEMFYRTGHWSRRKYLTNKYVYDPARELLQRGYVRCVDMMLFKETQQVTDYGAGRDHVRLILDPNFSLEHVVDDAFVARKTAALNDPDRPLRVLYFGRLVAYKGVDKMLDAVARARAQGAHLTFDIMGSGDQEAALRAQNQRLGLSDCVQFLPPRPYGPAFFSVLHARDVLLACPLAGDTPRSVWDALASGMPLVAFDTPFYRSMAAISQAVEVTPWPEVPPLAEALTRLAADKRRLIPQVESAVRTARENSGASWLKRRVAWVDELTSRRSNANAADANVA